jgi:hypothetical protein
MQSLNLGLLLSIFIVVFQSPAMAQKPGREVSFQTVSRLTETVLPLLEVRGSTLSEMLQYVEMKFIAFNPGNDDFRVIIQQPAIAPLVLPGQSPPTDPNSLAISLSVKAIPMLELLKMIAELSQTKFRIEGNTVIFAWQSDEGAFFKFYDTNDWKFEAQRIFSGLNDPNNVFFKAVAREAELRRAQDANFYTDDSWPLRLATIVAEKYQVTPQQGNPSINPLEFKPAKVAANEQESDQRGMSPQEIAHTAMPSVFTIVMTDSSGQSVSFGSGFLVKEDMLVTNFHVINVDTVNGGYITGNGLASPVQIVSVAYVDEAADIAVVKAQTPVGKPLILGSSSGLKIGAEVFVIGSPKGLGGTFSAGILSAMREVNQLFQLQISAPISSGSSGGPVLDHKGEVIGIAVSSIKTGQNLNFAIPVDYLIALLQGTRGRQLK